MAVSIVSTPTATATRYKQLTLVVDCYQPVGSISKQCWCWWILLGSEDSSCLAQRFASHHILYAPALQIVKRCQVSPLLAQHVRQVNDTYMKLIEDSELWELVLALRQRVEQLEAHTGSDRYRFSDETGYSGQSTPGASGSRSHARFDNNPGRQAPEFSQAPPRSQSSYGAAK